MFELKENLQVQDLDFHGLRLHKEDLSTFT